jgi:hypothetical protein
VRVAPEESSVIVEAHAAGLLAAVAHDLRIEAPIASGEADGERCTARFRVAAMKVVASRRHGTSAWRTPDERDARDVENRIRTEACPGIDEIRVEATVEKITVHAARTQTVATVTVVEDGKALGSCELSLAALGVGKIRVPLGAVKLDDHVLVTFDVMLRESR